MKKLLVWLKHPHGWGLILVYLVAALLIAGAVSFAVLSPAGGIFVYISYLFYLLSAVALGYVVFTTVYLVRNAIRTSAEKSVMVGRFVNDFEFRTLVFAVCSFIITFGYAVFDGLLAALETSVWYGALSAYYGLLAFMRGGLLINHRYGKKHAEISEEEMRCRNARSYRTCGILLIVLTLLLSGAIVQMVRDNRLFSYVKMSIYAAALYATIKIVMAIVNLFKAKKRENLTVQAIRCVSFAEALVSILALQTAMFAVFGTGQIDEVLFNSFVGAAVSIAIVVMGALMIRKGTRLLKNEPTDDGTDGS